MSGSSSLVLYLVLALNLAISWWNARSCGRAWVESKAVGGSIRVLVWCGAVQSAIGFSSVFLLPLLFAANAFAPDYFTDDQLQGALSLWYLTIIFPILGTGLIITIESWIAAYRNHSLMNLGLAAYNTFAQVHNTMGAINGVGPALSSVGKLFASVAGGRGDAKGKAAIIGVMIAVAIVVFALSAGALLTAALIHHYAGTVPLPQAASAAPAPGAAAPSA
jgi:hypothetical protein